MHCCIFLLKFFFKKHNFRKGRIKRVFQFWFKEIENWRFEWLLTIKNVRSKAQSPLIEGNTWNVLQKYVRRCKMFQIKVQKPNIALHCRMIQKSCLFLQPINFLLRTSDSKKKLKKYLIAKIWPTAVLVMSSCPKCYEKKLENYKITKIC